MVSGYSSNGMISEAMDVFNRMPQRNNRRTYGDEELGSVRIVECNISLIFSDLGQIHTDLFFRSLPNEDLGSVKIVECNISLILSALGLAHK